MPFFGWQALTFPRCYVYYNSNCMKNLEINDYSLENLKEELLYINDPEGSLSVDPQDNWLYRASEAAAESISAKYESNPEEEFYAKQ